MKTIIKIFRILLVGACCIFISGSGLSHAMEIETPADTLGPEVNAEAVATESVVPESGVQIGTAVEAKAQTLGSFTKKGVVYLPLVSVSSYLPVVAQVILMILVISLAGIFGAWLMFRFLAHKVLTLEALAAQIPVVANPSMASAATSPIVKVPVIPTKKENLPLVLTRRRPGTNLKRRIVLATDLLPTEAKKMSRKEKKKKGNMKPTTSSVTVENSGGLIRVGDRLVLKRPGESQAASAIRTKASSSGLQKARMPQKFLINDWFPLDQQ